MLEWIETKDGESMSNVIEKNTSAGRLISIDNGFYFDPDFLHSFNEKEDSIKLYNQSKLILQNACEIYKKRKNKHKQVEEILHPISYNKFLYDAMTFEVFCMLDNLSTYANASKLEFTQQYIDDRENLISLQRKFIKNFHKSNQDIYELINEYPCILDSSKSSHPSCYKFNLLFKNILDISHGTDRVKYWYNKKSIRKPTSLIYQIFFTRLNLLLTMSRDNLSENIFIQNISELTDIFALVITFVNNNIIEIDKIDDYFDFIDDPIKNADVSTDIKHRLKDYIVTKKKQDFNSQKILSHFYEFYHDEKNFREHNINIPKLFIENLNSNIVKELFDYKEIYTTLSPDLLGDLEYFELFNRAFLDDDKNAQSLIVNSPPDSLLSSLGMYFSYVKHLNLKKKCNIL